MRGQAGLLPDGLGRQRPAHRAAGAELLRGPLRPEPPLRPRLRARRPSPGKDPVAGLPAQLRRAVPAADRRGRAGLRAAVADARACRSTGRTPTPPSRDRAQRVSQRGFLRLLAAGPGLPARGPHALGRRLPDRGVPGRAGGPGAARAPTTGSASPGPDGDGGGRDRDHPARAAAGLRGPGGPPRRRALPAPVRHRGGHPPVRRAGAGPGPPAGRPREGLGHRHDLHLRRHHRRGLVARARPCPPGPSSGATAGSLPVEWGSAGLGVRRPGGRRPRPTTSWPAGPSSRPRPGSSSCWPRPGRSSASPGPSPTRSSSTRRATGRSRSSPPGSGSSAPCPCGTGCSSPGRGAPLAPALHGPPLPGLGGGAERRLEHQPAALLRRALPGLVPGRRRRRGRLRPAAAAPTRTGCRSTRRPTCPTGYAEDQRGQPGGFVGDPDVMDTWATSSLTPQIAGGWEDDPDLFARVFPMDLRPQAHEIIRTWLFSTVVRSELEHGVAARGPTPPSPAGCSTPTARRCRSPRATSSPRCRCSSSTGPTPSATGPPAAGRAPTPPSTRAR